MKGILFLTLATGNTIRIMPKSIASYVRYSYGDRHDNHTSIYGIDGKRWTVLETPEQIDALLGC